MPGRVVPRVGVEPALQEGGVGQTRVVVDELEHEELETVALLIFGLCARLLQVCQEAAGEIL